MEENQKREILRYQIFSFVFVSILGTILHFTYEWSGENKVVALFSSVNESTWEHLKLIYFPMLISIIIGYFYIGKNVENFLCAKIIGFLVAIIFTVTFFYTYIGILGQGIDAVNIITFFIAVAVGEYAAYELMVSKFKCYKKIAIVVLIIFLAIFAIFTYNTPKLGIFKDPITGSYGIDK